MAANEDRSSLWRTPLSTPVRTNDENGIQDLFRHSEKLLASAVSICRLKGSVECQTGGLITVCEELQRLLRLVFSENARIEKEMKKQKLTYDEDISLLKERVSYLEDEKEFLKKCLKDSTSKNYEELQRSSSKIHTEELPKQGTILTRVKTSGEKLQKNIKCKDAETNSASIDSVTHLEYTEESDKSSEENDSRKENVKPEVKTKGKRNEAKASLEDGAMETNCEDIDDVSLEILYLESPKASKTKTRGRKGSLNKVGKRAVNHREKSQKIDGETVVFNDVIKEKKDDAECVTDSGTSSKSRRSSRKSVTEVCKKKAESTTESPDVRDESISRSVHLNPDTGLIETMESEEEPVENQVQVKPRKNTKRKDKKKNSKDTCSSKKNLNEDTKETEIDKQKILMVDENLENMEEETCLVQKKSVAESPSDCKSNHPFSFVSEGQNDAGNSVDTTPDDNNEQVCTSVNSKPKSPDKTPEKEEVLGDVSFLIDISSMITAFVSTPDNTELELPLMIARERADARKLAGIFNLHISIGNKVDNRSSLLLSKTPNTKMPKPGKLDNLLSKLSIAASREADRANSKSRTKRKLPSVDDGAACNEEGSIVDSQSKKSVKNLSRSKKARL